MPKTAIGVFQDWSQTEQVIQEIAAEGVPRDSIHVLPEPKPESLGGVAGVLKNVGVPESAAQAYAEAARSGEVLIAVKGSDTSADAAARIMNRHGAIDIEKRVVRPRMPGEQEAAGLPFEPKHVAPPKGGIQTGRIRTEGEGARVFIW